MWHPSQHFDHLSIETTAKRNVFRFRCNHCELAVDIRMSGRSLAEYEARVDAFHFEHWHGGGRGTRPATRDADDLRTAAQPAPDESR